MRKSSPTSTPSGNASPAAVTTLTRVPSAVSILQPLQNTRREGDVTKKVCEEIERARGIGNDPFACPGEIRKRLDGDRVKGAKARGRRCWAGRREQAFRAEAPRNLLAVAGRTPGTMGGRSCAWFLPSPRLDSNSGQVGSRLNDTRSASPALRKRFRSGLLWKNLGRGIKADSGQSCP